MVAKLALLLKSKDHAVIFFVLLVQLDFSSIPRCYKEAAESCTAVPHSTPSQSLKHGQNFPSA